MMDARSWFLVSHTISFEAINSEMLIDTLGLYLYNTKGEPPAVAYCDNGSDYCAAGFSTPLAGTEDCSIFNELGIKLVNAIPYNARAKTIERCFRDMMQQFDKTFSDYLGSRPGERTQAAEYYDKHAEEISQYPEVGKNTQWSVAGRHLARTAFPPGNSARTVTILLPSPGWHTQSGARSGGRLAGGGVSCRSAF